MSKNRKNVAVLFGGRSVEHEISIITALQMMEALDPARYSAIPVYVAIDGTWYSGDTLSKLELYRGLPDSLKKVEKVALLPVPNVGGLTRLTGGGGWLGKQKSSVIPVDVYFPVFHGTYGEDGCMQGLFELAEVAYTGSGVLASAVGMNKFLSKCVAQSQDIPVLPGSIVGKHEIRGGFGPIRDRIKKKMDFPLFVKPCSLGSSVGIGRANDEQQLNAALVQVFDLDQYAIVEPCIPQPLEINVSVLAGEPPSVSVVEIPVVEDGGILGYEEKYMRGQGTKSTSLAAGTAGTARVIDPVDLPEALKESVVDYAVKIFSLMHCSGVARVDFICDTKNDRIYFNEINTLPGSLSYYLWAQSRPPILYTDLLNMIIEKAEADCEQASALRRDFGFRSLLRQS